MFSWRVYSSSWFHEVSAEARVQDMLENSKTKDGMSCLPPTRCGIARDQGIERAREREIGNVNRAQ